MNIHLANAEPAVESEGKAHLGFVDCDVHPMFKSPTELAEFLPKRWREHAATVGRRSRGPFAATSSYPRISPGNGMRGDAWPSNGGPPGSDLELMRSQLLDLFQVRHAIMLPLGGGSSDERNVDFGAALATAMNDWQATVWSDREPRLLGSVQISLENTEAAIAEIEKRAGDKRFAQVMIPPRSIEPLGRRRYLPILEACAANGFPIALHLGGTGGHPPTGSGWPSYYHEEHPSYVQTNEALTTSLVVEGVFERVPKLKAVLVEGGFAWIPPLKWRLDKHFKRMRDEVPHLKRLPSEYIHDHIWVTTQPIEEPEQRTDLVEIFEWIGWDRVMFSTDYPHWDQDDPRYAFRTHIPEAERRMIMRDNALALYGLG
jgi:predicted TIM-barrel fold metal-dependent hydrolase